MRSAETMFTTPGWPLPAASRVSIRWRHQRFWWPATPRFAGGKRRTRRPTSRRFWKRSPAWPTTQLPCARTVTRSLRRCWTVITSASMGPRRPTGRRDNEPGVAPGYRLSSPARDRGPGGYNPTRPPGLDRRPGDRDLLRDRGVHRLLLARLLQHQRRVFYGRARNDRVDCRPELRFRQPRLARADGLGRIHLPVRDIGHALVLDRRHSGHALSGHRDDAVLLHFEDSFGTRISQTEIWRRGPSPLRRQLCVHDHPHERDQYVLHGHCDEGGPGLGPELQHLGLFSNSGCICCAGWAEVGYL